MYYSLLIIISRSCACEFLFSVVLHRTFSYSWQSSVSMPFCGWDRPCHTAEGRWGEPELGRPWCHLQEPWGPELSPYAPPARSRVRNLFRCCLYFYLNPVPYIIVRSAKNWMMMLFQLWPENAKKIWETQNIIILHLSYKGKQTRQ